MIYRDFQGEQISRFAMGCMRLPVIDGDDSRIDEEHASRMVAAAMEAGCNYYDTAWGYHGGNSEWVMGRILANYPRDSFNLADKFPGYDPSCWDKVEQIFEEQLRKCQVDHFDFYLFHNVCEMNIDAYLDDAKYGIYSYLMEQKRNGRIRHLGFSCHGSDAVMKRFLDAYGQDMEFCQIQLNYIDDSFQKANLKRAMLAERNIPVWVMEPMRGGSLAKATEAEAKLMRAARPDESVAAWAHRWLQALPEVTTVLCGSSNMEQIQENLAIYAEDKPLTEGERKLLESIVRARLDAKISPCTACKYCMSHCPLGINIPWMMELYNEHKFTGGGFLAPMAMSTVPEGQRPGDCIACGSCAQVCPQQIAIPDVLAEFAAML